MVNGELSTKDEENPQELAFYLLDDETYDVGARNSIYLSHVVIPETYQGKPVIKFMDNGFKYNENIRSIVIGDNVKEID